MKLTLSGGRDSELLSLALVCLSSSQGRRPRRSFPYTCDSGRLQYFHLPRRQSSASIDTVQPCFSGYPHPEPPGRIHRASLFDRRLGYKVAASFCASETAQSAPSWTLDTTRLDVFSFFALPVQHRGYCWPIDQFPATNLASSACCLTWCYSTTLVTRALRRPRTHAPLR